MLLLRHGRHAGALLDRRRHRRRCRPRRSAGVEEVLGRPGQRIEVVEEPALAVLPPVGLLRIFKLSQLPSIMNDLSYLYVVLRSTYGCSGWAWVEGRGRGGRLLGEES